jgi:hypothetical protein
MSRNDIPPQVIILSIVVSNNLTLNRLDKNLRRIEQKQLKTFGVDPNGRN